MQRIWWLYNWEAGIISPQNSQGSSTSGELEAVKWSSLSGENLFLLRGVYLAKSGRHPVSCSIRSSWGTGTSQNSHGITNSVGGFLLLYGGCGAGPAEIIQVKTLLTYP